MIAILWLFMVINYNDLLNPNYADFHQCTNFEVWLYGATGCSKSYSAADKLLLQAIWQKDKPKIKIVVLRKTMPAIKRATLDILETRARDLHLPFELNKQDMVAECRNLQFVFLSTNNKEDFQKLKSLTNVDFIWINELLEIREEDYDECIRRCRGGHSDFEQIICDFNPEDKFSWVYKRGWESPLGKDVVKLQRNVYHNHPDYLATEKGQRAVARIERYKETSQNKYNIYFLGEWGSLQGVIFNWDVMELPNIRFDEIGYGGDFGYSVDPAALLRIYRKADEFWLEQVVYEDGLTNKALAQKMRDEGVDPNAEQIWDSAEPKSIQELCDEGFNAKPSRKGQDSVRFGVNTLLEKKIHIVDGSTDLIREARRLTWKTDKNGKSLNEPSEENDHAISAARYYIYTKFGHKSAPVARPATVDLRAG